MGRAKGSGSGRAQTACADLSLWVRAGDCHRKLGKGALLNCRLVSSVRNSSSNVSLYDEDIHAFSEPFSRF